MADPVPFAPGSPQCSDVNPSPPPGPPPEQWDPEAFERDCPLPDPEEFYDEWKSEWKGSMLYWLTVHGDPDHPDHPDNARR